MQFSFCNFFAKSGKNGKSVTFFFAFTAKKSIQNYKFYFFLSNSKRRDFEDSKTLWLFENWPILADFLVNSFRKHKFLANFQHNPCENQKSRFQAKIGPKMQFYGPECRFLVQLYPIDEKNRHKKNSLHKGSICSSHLP